MQDTNNNPGDESFMHNSGILIINHIFVSRPLFGGQHWAGFLKPHWSTVKRTALYDGLMQFPLKQEAKAGLVEWLLPLFN